MQEAKRAIEALRETPKKVRYKDDADILELEELHEAGAGKKLAESANFVTCNDWLKLSRQSKLITTLHTMFKPNGMDDICDLSKMLLKLGGHCHAFAPRFSFPRDGKHFIH